MTTTVINPETCPGRYIDAIVLRARFVVSCLRGLSAEANDEALGLREADDTISGR
jgi:hypothetical protein